MNLVLVKGVATDLYAATGITVGTQIRVQNQSEQLLLEIESLGVQTIFARLEFYEGPLDFPLV